MTVVVDKNDQRKGLRAVIEISEDKFNEMTPESQMSVMFHHQVKQTGTLNDLFRLLNGETGLIVQTKLNKASLSKAWRVILILFPGTLTIIGIFVAAMKYL